MTPRARRAALVAAGGIVAVLVVGTLLALSDVAELRARLAAVSLPTAALGAACALISYACIAGTQDALIRSLGHAPPRGFLLRASLVATTLSRALRSGGASGIAFLAWALGRHGVPGTVTVTAGIGIVLLNDLVFASMLLLGFVLLLASPADDALRRFAPAYGAGAVLLGGGFAVAWWLLRHEGARARTGRGLARIAEAAGRVARRPGWGDAARAWLAKLGTSLHALLERPRASARAWPWALARVIASLLSLGACARAAGIEVGPAGIVLAFAGMKLAGTLAVVPGGLGIVDGSLAGLLTLFGAPYEAALVAALVHRIAYHVVPGILAALLAGPLLGDALRGARPAQ